MAVRAAAAAAAAANGQSSNGTTVGANQPSSGSLADMIGRSNSTADPYTPTGTTGGLMQDASAGMVGGVSGVDDFRSTTEERLTALEGGGEGQQVQPSVNTLESGAVSDFIPQNQQKVIKAVVNGNKP